MAPELTFLVLTAASIGFFHTLMGPDHYLPFIALARSRGWSAGRTAAVTLACGVGHVTGSIVLGALGIGLGWALGGLESLEGMREDVAGWLLLGFGLAYTVWGLKQAARAKPHRHWHVHHDGEAHLHEHTHKNEHAHLHRAESSGGVTPWALFLIFVFGPCEPLIPVLMYPAAEGRWPEVALVTAVFAAATLATMLGVVLLARHGLERVPLGGLERYSHALAGLALVACGLAIRLGL